MNPTCPKCKQESEALIDRYEGDTYVVGYWCPKCEKMVKER